MKYSLKPLRKQVMVITGASSGIGAATARAAGAAGAPLVLACRNQEALESVAREIRAHGGEATTVAADVGIQQDHERILAAALQAYGGVDTWVNNAGVSIFGTLDRVPIEDQRKLFDTDYWGVVYGSMTAVSHMKQAGGALINIGSEVSDRAVPLQGAYSAAKHAVKGYTDALRMELQQEGIPVSVTLIKPASIATGFTQHARNYMDVEPRLPPPVYAPELVAKAILYAAEHPCRDLYVGSAAKAIGTLGQRMPGVADRMAGWLMRHQRSDAPRNGAPDALYEGGQPVATDDARHVRRHSVYTHLATRGRSQLWAGAGAALLLGGALLARRRVGWH
ncbi:SDR family oxidoreductase [Bordetella sp. 2513F-2]